MNVDRDIIINFNYLRLILEMLKNLNEMLTTSRRRIEMHRRIIQCIAVYIKRRKINRTIWTLERKSKYWEEEVPTYTNEKFKNDFRMSRESFSILVKKMDDLRVASTNMRESISLEKRIAIALYTLGSSAEYRTVANLFGVGRTTVGELVRNFCATVCNKMMEELSFYPPTEEKLLKTVKGFEKLGFPQCMGAVDGCHIEVCPKQEEAVDYYNYKGWYSVVLLAVCDHRCKFTYINVGSPGRNNDSYIFQRSLLYEDLKNNDIYAKHSRKICGVDVPLLLIGDSAFALSRYILKPYPYTSQQINLEKNYNYVLAKCRRVIENSFGQLKARFRRLLKGLEVNIENSTIIIKACCILHNFLKENEDELTGWADELTALDQRPQPMFSTTVGNNHSAGLDIRQAVTKYLEGSETDANVDVEAAETGSDVEAVAVAAEMDDSFAL